ncbi:hypothetical protein E5D57_013054 [Metarhizium anisopliae]|nr:hypothetical protein E5D57_013054 [Metarhizium anisopliae]
MLLCEGPGTNRYLTQEDFDVSLVEAAGTGSMDPVKLLVERGANVNEQAGEYLARIIFVRLLE